MNSPIPASSVYPYRQPYSSRAAQEEKQVLLDSHTGPDFHDLLQSVWKNSSDAMRITDSEGVIIAVNDAYSRFVGMQRGELVGEYFTIAYDRLTDPAPLVEKYCRRFSERSVEPLMSRRIRLANGKEAYVETSNSFIEGSDGGRYVLSIFHDITERKHMEQALERERALLATVINNLPDSIFAKDTDSRFILNNDAHIHALGAQSQSEVVGKSDFDFRARHLAEGMFIDDQEVIHSGKCVVEKEEQTVDPSGRTGFRLVTKVPMRDKLGTIVGLVGISRDVTDHKQAEEALKESERKYHDLFNNAVQGMFQSSVDGRLLSANVALLKMLGYDSIEELASVNLADMYANPDERRALSMKLAEQGSCSNVELVLRRRDGVVINVLEHSRAVKDSAGNVIAFEGILEDITERRALETRVQEHLAALKTSQGSLAELNAQKDRLFSILSHDLRSPFTSILGFCEILLNESESLSDAEQKEFLGHIENSARQQMALLNKLLDWSRLESGRIKFDVKDVDLSAVVGISVASHLGTAKSKEITLQSTLPKHMMTRGDEVMIVQVFSNLISNALKFTPTHGLISVDLVESKEDQWILAVRDTGAGIPKNDFGKLFKIEEKYTRKGLGGEEGTGLGLSVVHEIVKKHSGSITIESEIGKGTTFFVQFPRLMENVERSVLVVDDDEGVRVLHSRFLKRMFPDSRIIQASDGKEAFELAKRHHPRIIVSDYSMPEMNGFEFLNILRQEASTKDIPVFVITGKDSTASTEAMRLSGAAAVLTKPVSSTQLQEAIEKVMAERV
ncbi:MAG: hypothetical protein HW389_3156 [Bacteroidetes bacterium]|nr:hypothetical protein [Bacteroidota bacterium]